MCVRKGRGGVGEGGERGVRGGEVCVREGRGGSDQIDAFLKLK